MFLTVALPAWCGSVTLAPLPSQDAVLSLNYDFAPLTINEDINQNFPAADLLVSPSGRTENYRPFPCLIAENRIVSEIDTTPLNGYDVSSITASIQFDVEGFH